MAGQDAKDKGGKQQFPPQSQDHQPGSESEMTPAPDWHPRFTGTGKLKDKVAIVTGGDSGIGRAVSVAFAREGARVGIVYLEEHDDAEETKRAIEEEDSEALLIPGDVGEEGFCRHAVEQVVGRWKRLDLLVNNAAVQFEQESLTDISAEQLERTFRTNVFGYFFMAKAALPHLKKGAAIVNTTSVTAYKGSPQLLDYSATRGAVLAFTRSLSQSLVDKGIRVNGVAPGPIWTPLIPASFDAERTAEHGSSTPMKRAGQPHEVATCHLFLATDDSSYMTGQILHPNGGTIVNS